MAWDGTITRRISYVERLTTHMNRITFEGCLHKQLSAAPPRDLITIGELPCFECSRPHWDRIAEIRAEIDRDGGFESVLRKLAALR